MLPHDSTVDSYVHVSSGLASCMCEDHMHWSVTDNADWGMLHLGRYCHSFEKLVHAVYDFAKLYTEPVYTEPAENAWQR